MSGVFGKNVQFTIFGESHGVGVGGVLTGLAPGLLLDMEKINSEMKRRAPGQNKLSTPRQEKDEMEILSGVFEGRTTGAPLAFCMRNDNTRSKDYEKDKVRPSHSDFAGNVRFGGFNDYRGGGHFSGRLTAPLVFAGAIAAQYLEKSGITSVSHILSIGGVHDCEYQNEFPKLDGTIPTINPEAGEKMAEEIEKARLSQNSVGGVVEGAILGVPAGVGNPFFGSVESLLSSMFYSIPGVKGVSFGAGFDIAKMTGSQANDKFFTDGKKVFTKTNNSGGINGGISNGMPITFKIAFRPTPSISLSQNTVDIKKMENTTIEVHGRHDPCIVVRAVPVVEAAANLAILDLMGGKEWF